MRSGWRGVSGVLSAVTILDDSYYLIKLLGDLFNIYSSFISLTIYNVHRKTWDPNLQSKKISTISKIINESVSIVSSKKMVETWLKLRGNFLKNKFLNSGQLESKESKIKCLSVKVYTYPKTITFSILESAEPAEYFM